MGVSENKGHLIPRPCGGDPTISVAILGSPIFGNPHIRVLSTFCKRLRFRVCGQRTLKASQLRIMTQTNHAASRGYKLVK